MAQNIEYVLHPDAAIGVRRKKMVVINPTKGPGYHGVAEMGRPGHSHDLTRQTLAHAKVHGLPGHALAVFDQSRGSPGDSALTMGRLTFRMHVNASGKVEHPFDRG